MAASGVECVVCQTHPEQKLRIGESGGGDVNFLVGTRLGDLIGGGAGDDGLFGGGGDDTLSDGSGDDLLRGGADADRIVYAAPLDGAVETGHAGSN